MVAVKNEVSISAKISRSARQQIPLFVRALAGLLDGGVALDRAVGLAGETIDDLRFKPVSDGIAMTIRQGDSLSDALDKADRVWGKLFGDAFVALVRAGEVSGNVAEVLHQQAKTMERMGKLRRELASALIYPMLLAGVTFVSLMIIIGVVLPRLEALFIGLNGEVPMIAGVLIGLGKGAAVGLPVIFLCASGLLFWIMIQRKNTDSRIAQDRFYLSLPFIGRMLQQMDMQRFCRSFAALVRGGLPIPRALDLSASACTNSAIGHAVSSCRDSVLAGRSLSEAMTQNKKFFPSVLVQFSHVAVEATQVAQLFDHYADMVEEDLDIRAKQLIAVLEPGLVLTIGVVMAMIILALFQAILGLNQTLL